MLKFLKVNVQLKVRPLLLNVMTKINVPYQYISVLKSNQKTK